MSSPSPVHSPSKHRSPFDTMEKDAFSSPMSTPSSQVDRSSFILMNPALIGPRVRKSESFVQFDRYLSALSSQRRKASSHRSSTCRKLFPEEEDCDTAEEEEERQDVVVFSPDVYDFEAVRFPETPEEMKPEQTYLVKVPSMTQAHQDMENLLILMDLSTLYDDDDRMDLVRKGNVMAAPESTTKIKTNRLSAKTTATNPSKDDSFLSKKIGVSIVTASPSSKNRKKQQTHDDPFCHDEDHPTGEDDDASTLFSLDSMGENILEEQANDDDEGSMGAVSRFGDRLPSAFRNNNNSAASDEVTETKGGMGFFMTGNLDWLTTGEEEDDLEGEFYDEDDIFEDDSTYNTFDDYEEDSLLFEAKEESEELRDFVPFEGTEVMHELDESFKEMKDQDGSFYPFTFLDNYEISVLCQDPPLLIDLSSESEDSFQDSSISEEIVEIVVPSSTLQSVDIVPSETNVEINLEASGQEVTFLQHLTSSILSRRSFNNQSDAHDKEVPQEDTKPAEQWLKGMFNDYEEKEEYSLKSGDPFPSASPYSVLMEYQASHDKLALFDMTLKEQLFHNAITEAGVEVIGIPVGNDGLVKV